MPSLHTEIRIMKNFARLAPFLLMFLPFLAWSQLPDLSSVAQTITADDNAPAFKADRDKQEQKIAKSPLAVLLYKPTYVLPAYYTAKPYQAVYQGDTPDDQRVDELEFKTQFSLKLPVIEDIFKTKTALYVAYTQLFYWQFYANSQWFRETNYEPEFFFYRPLSRHLSAQLGVVHQSNGRGGQMERSWNRAYLDFQFSRGNWYVSTKPWLLIFKSASSDLHNPNIENYLGHGRLVISYKYHNQVFSLMSRNNLESGFSRGANEVSWSFPIFGHIKGYAQFFNGYGQSLIEYDHYTYGGGIGIAINDWV